MAHVTLRVPGCQDHKDLHQDYDAFPYRIFHGIVDVRILNRLKGCRLAEQVALSEAIGVQKAEDLEISFFRDASHAVEVSKITGDLIALVLGVKSAHAFRSDMTLQEFVEVFTLVDKVPHQDRKCERHPDALMRIVGCSVVPVRVFVHRVAGHSCAKTTAKGNVILAQNKHTCEACCDFACLCVCVRA